MLNIQKNIFSLYCSRRRGVEKGEECGGGVGELGRGVKMAE